MENLNAILLVLSFVAGQVTISLVWYLFLYKKLSDVIAFEQESKIRIQNHNYLLVNQVLGIKQSPVFIPDAVQPQGQPQEYDGSGRRSDAHEAAMEQLSTLGTDNGEDTH